MRSISTYLQAILLAVLLLAAAGSYGCKQGGGPDTTATVDTGVPKPQTHDTAAPPAPAPVPTYTYEVVNSYPHDPAAFTEGLLYSDGFLYESTGMPGTSWLRKVELQTGKVVKQGDLDSRYFGEGLALFNHKLYQLTWQNQTGFVYDGETFQQEKTFTYYGEGWGLTHDDASLIMSDGTSFIRFLDPTTLEVKRVLPVTSGSSPVNEINELEYVNGEIYANIWKTDRIARIDPGSGNVKGWIDLTGILPSGQRSGKEDVLNGIAYDQMGNRLFVTGKYWARIFEIKLKEQKAIASR
jgi:glutamine cyclotransferase